jgi:hypothetical protein
MKGWTDNLCYRFAKNLVSGDVEMHYKFVLERALIILVERGRRQGTDTGANCSRGHEMRGAGGGRKGGRVERKEATSRQERERGAGEEAKGRGAIEGR